MGQAMVPSTMARKNKPIATPSQGVRRFGAPVMAKRSGW